MVRVLAVSDEVVDSLHHPQVRRLRPDLVVGTGDLPWDYLEFLASALDVPVVFVPGNHDPEVGVRRTGWRAVLTGDGMPAADPRPWGCTNADGAVVEAAGLRIAGLGGSIRYNRGPNQYTQAQLARRARRLLRRVGDRPLDLLLTHSPPRGLGDEDDPPHHGFEALHDVLEQARPTWHLHGHVHPYGLPKPDRHVGGTTVRNVIPWQLVDVDPRRGRVGAAAGGGHDGE
jgi:calcineurin-like phosphoesterase family protein